MYKPYLARESKTLTLCGSLRNPIFPAAFDRTNDMMIISDSSLFVKIRSRYVEGDTRIINKMIFSALAKKKGDSYPWKLSTDAQRTPDFLVLKFILISSSPMISLMSKSLIYVSVSFNKVFMDWAIFTTWPT